MSPRYDKEWLAGMLDTEGRLGTTRPEELLVATGLGERQIVVDVGCGPGFLTIPAAMVVGPHGQVYAVDVEPKMLDLVNSKAAASKLENIITVLSSGQNVPLADHVADYAICALLLHDRPDFESRADMARDIVRLVQPGGHILVIEWVPKTGDDRSRRLTPEETAAVLHEASLVFEGPHPLGEKQYMMVASRWAA